MGTSRENPEWQALGVTSGMIWGQRSGGEHPSVFADRAIGRALHGGDYQVPEIHERLLRYHNVADAVGGAALGGEAYEQ